MNTITTPKTSKELFLQTYGFFYNNMVKESDEKRKKQFGFLLTHLESARRDFKELEALFNQDICNGEFLVPRYLELALEKNENKMWKLNDLFAKIDRYTDRLGFTNHHRDFKVDIIIRLEELRMDLRETILTSPLA